MSSIMHLHSTCLRSSTPHMRSSCHWSSPYVTPPVVHTPRTPVVTSSVVHATTLGSSRLRSSTPFRHVTPPVIHAPHTPVTTPSVVHAATLGSSRLRSSASFGLSRHWSCMIVMSPVIHVTRSQISSDDVGSSKANATTRFLQTMHAASQ